MLAESVSKWSVDSCPSVPAQRHAHCGAAPPQCSPICPTTALQSLHCPTTTLESLHFPTTTLQSLHCPTTTLQSLHCPTTTLQSLHCPITTLLNHYSPLQIEVVLLRHPGQLPTLEAQPLLAPAANQMRAENRGRQAGSARSYTPCCCTWKSTFHCQWNHTKAGPGPWAETRKMPLPGQVSGCR